MRIEVTDGQRLHLGEHIVADVAQEALRDDRHRLVIEDRGAQRNDIHCPHAENDPEQRLGNVCPLRALLRKRRNDLGKHELEEHRGTDTRRCRCRYTDKYGDHPSLIIMEKIGEQPAEYSEGMHFGFRLYGLTHEPHLLPRRHCRSCSANNKLLYRSRWRRAAHRACRRR